MTKSNIWFSKTAGSLAILLACASCASEDMLEADYNLGRQKISLQVVTSDNQTTRTPGDDNLNENRFVSLDYYFFAENNDVQTLLLHKSEGTRLSEGNSTLDVSQHTYTGSLSDADLQALFGANAADGAQCYVYVLANLDASTRDAVNAKTVLSEIKRVSFQDANIKLNGKQDCFVMFGGGPVSLTTDATTGVRTLGGNPIMMTRDAAKIVLTVTSVQEELVVKDNNDQVTSKWKSLPDQMHVMFYNGVNKSYVHSLINTGSHYVPTGEDDCFFDLTATNDEWRQLSAENSEAPYTNLTHQYPIYSYLADWRENEDDASYMILVLPWQEVDPNNDTPIGTPRPTYYQIETSPTNTYYENYFYHISIKVGILGSFELPEPVELQSTYMIVPWENKDVEAKLSEPSYLIVETNQYTMNNVSTGSVPYITSHDLTQAYVSKVEYLNTGNFQSVTRTNNNPGLNTTFQTNTYVNNESFQVSTADGKVTLTHNISPDQYTRYNVTVVIRNSKGLEEEIVFTIYPAIYADIETGGDAFVNGRFTHVQNAVGSGTGNNMPWYGRGGYNWYANENHNNNDFWISTGYGSLRFNLGTGGVNNEALTRIKVTSFNEGDDIYQIRANNVTTSYSFKLTDPRVESTINSNLTNYIVTGEANRTNYNQHTESWNNKANIMLGSPSSDAIAPEFIICSGWGRTNGENAQNFQTFERRCATYQEAGYPAGRWRIPTEAELTFIYRLQALGVIPVLFQQNNSAYWASSGRAIESYNAETLTANFNANPNVGGAGRAGVRCVYDVWYWGDDKMSANEYHAMPTK